MSSVEKSPQGTADRPQSGPEELVNAISHGLGALLGVAGLVVLVVLAALHGDAWQVVASSIYGSTLVLLYLSSTLYHAFRGQRVKRVFQAFDHAGIFLLIAGTYTPFTLVTIRGPWGWTLFGVIWGLGIAGAVLEVVFLDRFPRLSLAFYLAMGWAVVAAIVPLVRAMTPAGLAWLVAGGIAYTAGTLFYRMGHRRFMHGIWHLFVLAGSICHWFAVLAEIG